MSRIKIKYPYAHKLLNDALVQERKDLFTWKQHIANGKVILDAHISNGEHRIAELEIVLETFKEE